MSILLIATGGTIASTVTDDGSVAVTRGGADLLAGTARSMGGAVAADVEVIEAAGVPSWDLRPERVAGVVIAARDALDGGRATGVVVTHGTDTLEETAFLADLVAGAATMRGPVVVTGSMRNGSEVDYDGYRNLADALAVARSAPAEGRGALVCLHGEVHAARYVTKTDTSSLATFRSPALGPVGRVEGGVPRFLVDGPAPITLPVGPDPAVDAAVEVVLGHGGVDDGIIPYYLDRGARGLVVVGTGAGNVNSRLVPGIERAVGAGVPVVVVSRCATGRVAPVYGGPGGGFNLRRSGVIGGGGLGWARARLALMVALAADSDPLAVSAWFAQLLERR
ncbi:MAG: asparaginase [Acidimicrobiia bacterium]